MSSGKTASLNGNYSHLSPSPIVTIFLTNFMRHSECVIGYFSNISCWYVREGADVTVVQGIGEICRTPIIRCWFNKPIFSAFLDHPGANVELWLLRQISCARACVCSRLYEQSSQVRC
jgi:hypothetical protein